MATYVATTKIGRKQFNRINRLLAEVDFDNSSREMEDIIRELGATEDAWDCGFQFNFKNGTKIFIDIRSGSSNYYDDIMWKSDDDEVLFDCNYELNEENEFCIDDDTYYCNFEFEEDDYSENYKALANALFAVVVQGKKDFRIDVKWYEIEFQKAVEQSYPDGPWYRTLENFSIFHSLLVTQDPALTALAILELRKEDK